VNNKNNDDGCNPGPMARFEEMKCDPYLFWEIAQRIGEGWTLYGIARGWQVPQAALCDWFKEQAALGRRRAMRIVSRVQTTL